MSTTLELVSSEREGKEIPGIEGPGAYLVLVSDVDPKGTSAVFAITSSQDKNGSIFRCSTSVGSSSETLTIAWPAVDAKPRLVYMALPKDEGNRSFKVKVVGIDSVAQ